MNKILLFASLLVGVLLTACSNDFEVNAKWKDIPVVYGLLDLADSAHYIRVERAFLDPKADALELAKNPDSIYYENAIVTLERLSNNQIFTLTKVDGNTWGHPREDGVFATAPNWLYRIDSAALLLKAGEKIRLHIDRGNGLPDVTSQTVIVAPSVLLSPSGTNSTLNFTSKTTDISWKAADSAFIFDANLYVNYAEYVVGDPANITYHSIKWPWAKGLRRESNNNSFTVEKDGTEFFDLIKNNIPVDQNKKRIFQGIDLELISGGQYLENYVSVTLANTGITSSGEIPTYTNMSEGLGIFDAVNKFWRYNIGLDNKSRDSLKMGYRTANLNF